MGSPCLPLPPVYLVHNEFLRDSELLALERQLGGALRYNIKEANIILARGIKGPRRAIQELQSLGVAPKSAQTHTTGIIEGVTKDQKSAKKKTNSMSLNKWRNIDKTLDGKDVIILDSSTESEDENKTGRSSPRSPSQGSPPLMNTSPNSILSKTLLADDYVFGGDTVKFLSLEWYFDSISAGSLLPPGPYLLWEGTFGERHMNPPTPQRTLLPTPEKTKNILERARADTPPRQLFHEKMSRSRHSGGKNSQTLSQRPQLLHESTSEHDLARNLPLLPSYFGSPFSCHWRTPLKGPNEEFIAQLKLIREERLLMRGDRISADQKSRAIAAIAAYPYTIISHYEIERLPGCGPSTVGHFQEWKTTGRIKDIQDLEYDEKFQSMKTFYGIYDVGEKKALEFYKKGWRDLDDLVENWGSLTENQQVGVKYYDDFAEKIPRAEVEYIGSVILKYANQIREGFQMVITGGYRRGKTMSGDVDVILTHPDEEATQDFVREILYQLGKDKWITQQLVTSSRNSARYQEPVTWKGSMPRSHGGFDTLDKGLVVWQNADLLGQSSTRNPKRRVDIIISPWKTAGCAIIGWSGGTQFEKDLRKYVNTLDPPLKFDSSGVVVKETGEWQDLEGDCMDLLEKEKRVFKGLKLDWREPTERCN